MKKIVDLKKISKINTKEFLSALKTDKKATKNQIRIVLTKGYGKMFLKKFKNDKTIVLFLNNYINHINNL